MRFEPSGDLETPYVFEQVVVGGAVPKNYFPAVEKGLQECVQKGPLAAYPVVGVKATLYDGSYHPVDSSEMAFKTATIQAFKKGFMEASPVLLEPIVSVKVTVPDEYTGDVMGDLNKRRGRVLGMTPVGAGNQIVEADVPMTGLFGYCTTLRSMTGGRGTYEYTFARYEQAPSEVQEAEIAKRAAEEQKDKKKLIKVLTGEKPVQGFFSVIKSAIISMPVYSFTNSIFQAFSENIKKNITRDKK